jgi:arsenite-transporting ATPase
LQQLGDLVFGDRDPTSIFYKERVEEIQKVGDTYQLQVRLPFASGHELSIMETGNEIIVHMGRYRRNILLPMVLTSLSVQEARLDQDLLTLSFKAKAPSSS